SAWLTFGAEDKASTLVALNEVVGSPDGGRPALRLRHVWAGPAGLSAVRGGRPGEAFVALRQGPPGATVELRRMRLDTPDLATTGASFGAAAPLFRTGSSVRLDVATLRWSCDPVYAWSEQAVPFDTVPAKYPLF